MQTTNTQKQLFLLTKSIQPENKARLAIKENKLQIFNIDNKGIKHQKQQRDKTHTHVIYINTRKQKQVPGNSSENINCNHHRLPNTTIVAFIAWQCISQYYEAQIKTSQAQSLEKISEVIGKIKRGGYREEDEKERT